jgi:HSP20 family protein
MMRLIWSPTRDLLQMQARLGRALGDPGVRRWGRVATRAAAMPPLDFSETPESFVIRVDLPGVTKDEVELTVADGRLEIAGETPPVNSEDESALPRKLERLRGPFRRIVPLPRQANSAAITATLEKGVLTLQVPKIVPDGGRKIEIG